MGIGKIKSWMKQSNLLSNAADYLLMQRHLYNLLCKLILFVSIFH